MGKNNKKRKHASINADQDPTQKSNPLQTAQESFLKSLSAETRLHFFSSKHVSPEQRAEIWENQADLGEKLVNKYAWATPDARLLKVFQYFSPIVEIGCGSNAYWAKWMHGGGVDVIAFDASPESGGKIDANGTGKKMKNKGKQSGGDVKSDGLTIRRGGPTILSTDKDISDSKRTLFLCYPDEEEYHESESEEEDEDSYTGHDMKSPKPKSMGAACLQHFTGSTIIHVGELYGDTLGLDQSPWGRSSSCEFQERLAAEYHCILRMKLTNNWLHVKDTLSVWKRSEICEMVYENDSDDEDGSTEEECYKYIPPEEQLPLDAAAPCVAHLLSNSEPNNSGKAAGTKQKKIVDNTEQPNKTKKTKKKI